MNIIAKTPLVFTGRVGDKERSSEYPKEGPWQLDPKD